VQTGAVKSIAEARKFYEGVLGLRFKTKANSIDADVVQMIYDAVERAERDFRGLVVSNSGEFFCVFTGLFLGLAEAVMLAQIAVGIAICGDGDADAGYNQAMRLASRVLGDDGEDDFTRV